jgi:hypothetical protein
LQWETLGMLKVILGVAAILLFPVAALGDADKNLQIMLDAARKLEPAHSNWPHAFMLVKTSIVRSPVAVVFGYIDNGAACEELATGLNQVYPQHRYECDEVY